MPNINDPARSGRDWPAYEISIPLEAFLPGLGRFLARLIEPYLPPYPPFSVGFSVLSVTVSDSQDQTMPIATLGVRIGAGSDPKTTSYSLSYTLSPDGITPPGAAIIQALPVTCADPSTPDSALPTIQVPVGNTIVATVFAVDAAGAIGTAGSVPTTYVVVGTTVVPLGPPGAVSFVPISVSPDGTPPTTTPPGTPLVMR